jgi:uncharacterized membrane protein YhaH (DUF805 family)
MSRIADGIHWLAITAWVGSLWAIGLMAAPTLFHYLPDHALAGSIAGRLFTYVALIGLACAGYLLLFRLVRFGGHVLRQAFFWIVLVMLLLTLAGQFGVQPILATLSQEALPHEVMESVFRDRFATWHGVASVIYLIECVLGAILVWLQPDAPR